MVFKPLEATAQRWRVVNGPDLVALVRAGGRFRRAGEVVPDFVELEVAVPA
jgi:hypothetical protein